MARRKQAAAATPIQADEIDEPGSFGPRTRTVRTMTEEEVPVIEAGDDSGEEMNPLDQLLAELGGGTDYDIAVYRLDKNKPNGRVFCGPLSAGGLSNSSMVCTRLQQEFGGGDFYLQVKDPETSTFIRRIVVSVEAPKVAPVPPAQMVQESVAASIKAAMEPMQHILAQLVAAQSSRPAFNLDTLANSAIKFLPLLQMARGLLAPSGGAELSIEKYLEFKTKMDALGLGDSEPSALAQASQLFKEFGKPLIDAMQAQQNRAPAGLPPGGVPMHNPMAVRAATPSPRPAAAPGVVSSATITAPGNGSTAPNIEAQIAPFVGAIATMAHAGESPEAAAEKIITVIPDALIDPMCDAIESGELVSILTKNMTLAGYSVWLEKVGQEILAALEPDDTDGAVEVDSESDAIESAAN